MKVFLLSMIFFLSTGAGALAHRTCTPGAVRDLLSCAEAHSPEVEKARLEVEHARTLVGAAGQWKNPELAAEIFRGRAGSGEFASTEISLGVPIELGGKVAARVAGARAAVSAAEGRLFLARTRTRADVLSKLHRLRQVLHELEIVDEAIRTFGRLIDQYRKRPGLSPEQKASLSVYQLAKGEYELKRLLAKDEILAIGTFFRVHAGADPESLTKYLPSSPRDWPKVAPSSPTMESAARRILGAEVESANAEVSVARGESWPTLLVGPSMQIVREAGRNDHIMGFNVSLPLPLFNVNGAGRAAAVAGLNLSEAKMRLGLREEEIRRDELRRIYEASVGALSGGISHEEIEKRHRESERLFLRGMVPSSLVIDAHRTSFDLEKTRHEREMRAIEALLEIRRMDGEMLEVFP